MANDDLFQTIDVSGDLGSQAPLPSSQSSPASQSSQPRSSRRFRRRSPEAVGQVTGADGFTIGRGCAHDPSTAMVPSQSDRYERIAELGRGGWGVVDRVVDWQLEREVAVKKIGGDGKVDPEVRQRFLYEAKITSQLQHPGVVPVHELGASENGEAYYVMKLLEGDTLRQLIRSQHALSKKSGHRWTSSSLDDALAPLLDRFISVCNAVAYAHQQGVIHRDLKPSNVMVGNFGETIVVDWGLAKSISDAPAIHESAKRTVRDIEQNAEFAMQQLEAVQVVGPSASDTTESDSAHHTTQGSIVGTPAYMSPEQAYGRLDQLGPASDIYSLGVMLYEIACGRNPYQGQELLPIIEQVRAGKWPRLRSVQPLVRGSLAAICEKAMAFDPKDRYLTASDLAEDLRHYISGDAVAAYDEPMIDRLGRYCRRHQAVTIAVTTSTVILLVASILFGTVIHRAHQSEKASRIASQYSHQTAVKSLTEARDAADAWLVDLSGSLEFYPGLETIRVELLTNAIGQYEKLLVDQLAISEDQQSIESLTIDEHGHLLTATLEAAKCQLRLGDLYRLTSRNAGASQYYERAAELLSQLDRRETGGERTSEFTDSVRLLQINVAIGRRLLMSNSTSEVPSSGQLAMDDEYPSHRDWLLSQLPSDLTVPAYASGRSHSHQAQAASALVRYPLAIYRSSAREDRNGELLQHAVQWSRWLFAVRGEPRDIGLSEAVQRELAIWHETSNQHELAVATWDRLISDIQSWHDEAAPRPDRLQSLAHARMRYAQCVAGLGRTDDAANAYRFAIDELNQAWQLLDADSFHQTNLADAQHNLGSLLAIHSPDARVEARPLIERSLTNYQNLLRKNPSPENIRRLSEAHASLAVLLCEGDFMDAIGHYDNVVLGCQMLADHQQLTEEDSLAWAEALQGRAQCLVAASQFDVARRDLQEINERFGKLELGKLERRDQDRWAAVQAATQKLEVEIAKPKVDESGLQETTTPK